MTEKINKAVQAAERHFEDAANSTKGADSAIQAMATGMVCLTGIISDLLEEVSNLRSEVRAHKESN